MGMITQLLAPYTGKNFTSDLLWLVTVIVSIAGAFMTLYTVYIGYLFMTATDEGKRKAAKDRLFKVLSSVLIIFALAASLSVINVTFDTSVKGEESKSSVPNVDYTALDYEYNGTPSFTIKANEVSELQLVPTNVRIKDGSTMSGVKFTNFQITNPELPPNKAGNEGVQVIQIDSGGTLTFRYKCIATEDSPATINCYESNGRNVLYGTAKFNYGNQTGCTVTFYILVKLSGSNLKLNSLGPVK